MKLYRYLTEGINDKGILKCIFMVGHPGSGKTYSLTRIKSGRVEPRIVNTDRSYPLFKEWWNDDWGKISVKVKTLTINQLALYINSLLPLVIDGTANKTSVILRRVGLLESFGYDVGAVAINTSLETAIERASRRKRHVDPEFIKTVYNQVNKAKSFYRSKFHTWIEVDNDEGMLTDEVIMRAFKFMGKFYHSPLVNPVGVETVEEMKENGWKYLDPNVRPLKEIQNVLGAWYKG